MYDRLYKKNSIFLIFDNLLKIFLRLARSESLIDLRDVRF